MTRALAILALAASLSSCASVGGIEGGVRLGINIYCMAVTEEGKQAIRDILTGGQQVIACPQGTAAVVR